MSLSTKHLEILSPFLRHHAIELECARQLEHSFEMPEPDRVALSVEVAAMCSSKFAAYFAEEEKVLKPFVKSPSAWEGLKRRHERFERLANWLDHIEMSNDPGPERLSELGEALAEYVRWQEDVVFPELEKTLAAKDWLRLSQKTANIVD